MPTDLEMVQALIEAGADVDIQDEMRTSAFLATGETGNVAILRAVLRADKKKKKKKKTKVTSTDRR